MTTEKDPWAEFATRHCKGDQLDARISKIVNDLGLFCELDDIYGIVHIVDIDWTAPGEEAVLDFRVGQNIRVVILQVDPSRQRVSLGIKQLKPRSGDDPAAPVPAKTPPGGPKPQVSGAERAQSDTDKA
jgi:small subunit ribosomal protein S1